MSPPVPPSGAGWLRRQLDIFGSGNAAAQSAPAALPAPSANTTQRQIQLGPRLISYTLRRSQRRSVGFMINDDGLRITAPKSMSITELDAAIRSKQQWILSKLQERHERAAQRIPAPQVWGDGTVLPYLGANITLKLRILRTSHITFDADSGELLLYVPADTSEKKIKERVRAWFQAEAKRLFAERLPLYAARLGVTYQSLTLSSARTQWGSCSTHGAIRLNWRLMHFSPHLIDYVVAHELAHRREMNHSPQFWATVGEIFPEYKQARQDLRRSAQAIGVVL
jgi:predicted metal-dependent hydrolase